MIKEIIIDALIDLWDEKLSKVINWKNICYTGVSLSGILMLNEIKKGVYHNYLDIKINDIYNPVNLTKHVWISGVQGSGKSNKLRRIFINTFVKQSLGGIYIDTHGTADLVLQSIPKERWDDVIYIAPWMKRLYGLNILQRYSNDSGEIDRISEDVVEVFHKMYPRSWGDKLANAIRFATKTILIAEECSDGLISNPTLIEVYRVLTEPLFRDSVFKFVDNTIITDFLENIKNNPAIQKLANPLSSENITLFLCQSTGINLYEAMENNKIIICNLDQDKLSNNGNFIASIIVSILTQCAAKRSESIKHPYFAIAMDEFYEYANKHIRVLIEQMRKKNVCLLLANQHREQLPSSDIKSAVSMCQTKFIHTPADEDLNWVSKLYGQWFSREFIQKMPFYHCIHDIHDTKTKKPFISPVPMFIGDNNWDYVKELKFYSLGKAPERYKLAKEVGLKMAKPMHNEAIIIGGEVKFNEDIIGGEIQFGQ